MLGLLSDADVWKVRLIKGLYDRGLSAEDVRQLYRFIDWIMYLPESLERLVWQEITTYQEEKRMPFITFAERVGMEKGLEKGLLKGKELDEVLDLRAMTELGVPGKRK